MIKPSNSLFGFGSEPAGKDLNLFAPDNHAEKPAAGTFEKGVLKAFAKEPYKGFADKPPVFEYNGAAENISDIERTFDELRAEKSADFPELEDGKRVSWTVEYGRIIKTVDNPKGMSIGRMKAGIEKSIEFAESFKKSNNKNPVCKVKPRVTAQSKGTLPSYKGVFATMDEALAAAKAISIVPAKDGKVYEIRDTEMGFFITPAVSCETLSDIKAGFTPSLPRIPSDLMMKVIAFFRHYTQQGGGNEALANIYWDKDNREFIADVPEQAVTGMSVDAQTSGQFADDRYIHYMDIHSHNSMRAFFSQADDRDEKATRLYTVIGRLDGYFPEIKTRISNGGMFLEIDPAEVFERLGAPFPEEWKSKVRFRKCHCKNKRGAFCRFLLAGHKIILGVKHHAVCAG
jgi:PRTRC genetic system protein A